MRSYVTINENRDFMYLYRKGKCICADSVVIYFKKNRLNRLRLGITVTKKVGKAVVRNRIKRRLREIFGICAEQIPHCYDIVIVARTKAAETSFSELHSAVRFLLHKANLI